MSVADQSFQNRFQSDFDLVLAQLSAPFAPAQLRWERVAGTARDLAGSPVCDVRPHLTYAALLDRLNGLLGGGWSTQTMHRSGEPVLVVLSIYGVARSATGASYEDALMLASELFGVGRYLREVPTQTVDLDADGQFETPDLARLLPELSAKRTPLEYLLSLVLDSPDHHALVRHYLTLNRLWTVDDARALALRLHFATAPTEDSRD